MLNKKLMKEWISETVTLFKSVMPEIDAPYPEIHILSVKNINDTRSSIVEQLRSPQKKAIPPSFMETVHGSNGDAIIIYHDFVMENKSVRTDDKGVFQHSLLHELGRFFSIYMECQEDDLYRYLDQRVHIEDFSSQLGYWFWNEFISEVIACNCEPEGNVSDCNAVKKEFGVLLKDAFSKYEDFIDQYALAKYYAKLLADKGILSLLEAVKNGSVLIAQNDDLKVLLLIYREKGSDPEFRSDIAEFYYPLMKKIQEMLRAQLMKEHYWETDIDFITEIGHKIEKLRNIKLLHSPQKEFGNLLQGLSKATENEQ